MTSPTIALSVSGLSKRFSGVVAVDDASFQVARNQVTSLVGPNGAGKTTIFNMIAGQLRPDAGRVLIDDNDVTDLPAHSRVGMGVARTFQDTRLINELSVWENLALGRRDVPGRTIRSLLLHPVGSMTVRRQLRESADELLELVGLPGKANDRVGQLSYGDKKLVSLAQALGTGADILMLDEPTSGLNEQTVDSLVGVLREVVGRGRTILIVEHNMKLVRRFSDEMVFLNHGRVEAAGRPEDLMDRADLRDVYFGRSSSA